MSTTAKTASPRLGHEEERAPARPARSRTPPMIDGIDARSRCLVVRYCQIHQNHDQAIATTNPHSQASETQSTCHVVRPPSVWCWPGR